MQRFESKISGTGIYLPKKILTNADLEKMVDTSDKWIYERTGIRERRISSTEGGEFPTDMALHATKQALAAANMKVDDIEIRILVRCCRKGHPTKETLTETVTQRITWVHFQ